MTDNNSSILFCRKLNSFKFIRTFKVWSTINSEINLTVSPPFYNDPNYIKSLCDSISKNLPNDFDYLLFSYHGIPERHVRKMDPTSSHCLESKDCCEKKSVSHQFCYMNQVKMT